MGLVSSSTKRSTFFSCVSKKNIAPCYIAHREIHEDVREKEGWISVVVQHGSKDSVDSKFAVPLI